MLKERGEDREAFGGVEERGNKSYPGLAILSSNWEECPVFSLS